MCISRTFHVGRAQSLIRCAFFVGLLAVVGLLMTGPLMAQTVIVNQQGTANPASNGFTLNAGGITSQGPAGNAAWNIQGTWCCGYDSYHLSSSQVSQLNAAGNWAFVVTYQNLSPDTGPGYLGWACGYGSIATIQVNGVRFDLGQEMRFVGHGRDSR